jgi:hypothetical protein
MDRQRISAPTTEALKRFYGHMAVVLDVTRTVAGVIAFNPIYLWNVDETWMDALGKILKVRIVRPSPPSVPPPPRTQ